MSQSKLRTVLLIAEAALCFALPAYLLFWGLTAPSDGRPFAAIRNTAFAIAGLAAIWSTATDDFSSLGLDAFTVAVAVVPSLCVAHFLVLALRKAGRAQSR